MLASSSSVWQALKLPQATCSAKVKAEAQPMKWRTYATVTCWLNACWTSSNKRSKCRPLPVVEALSSEPCKPTKIRALGR